jgi:hypothetical protein
MQKRIPPELKKRMQGKPASIHPHRFERDKQEN